MAKEQLTENDDLIDENDILIDEPANDDVVIEDEGEKPKPEADTAEEDEDDASEQDDERLGEDEDGSKKPSKAAIRRRFRKLQLEREKQELMELRAFRETAEKRFAALEATTLDTNYSGLTSQISQAEADLATVEQAITKAVDDGDGATFAQATQLRDQIKARLGELKPAAASIQEAKQKLTQPQTQPMQQANPAAEYERQWMAANPWFNAQGDDERSTTAKLVHQQMIGEGYNPATQAHWPELSRRLKMLIEPDEKPARKPAQGQAPTGMGREQGTPATRAQIRLSAERVQAIKDAGYWDDPVERTKMIKAYQEYDRNNQKGA